MQKCKERYSLLNCGNISPPHDLLDCRKLCINTNHFCHAVDESASPSLIGDDCAVLYFFSKNGATCI